MILIIEIGGELQETARKKKMMRPKPRKTMHLLREKHV